MTQTRKGFCVIDAVSATLVLLLSVGIARAQVQYPACSGLQVTVPGGICYTGTAPFCSPPPCNTIFPGATQFGVCGSNDTCGDSCFFDDVKTLCQMSQDISAGQDMSGTLKSVLPILEVIGAGLGAGSPCATSSPAALTPQRPIASQPPSPSAPARRDILCTAAAIQTSSPTGVIRPNANAQWWPILNNAQNPPAPPPSASSSLVAEILNIAAGVALAFGPEGMPVVGGLDVLKAVASDGMSPSTQQYFQQTIPQQISEDSVLIANSSAIAVNVDSIKTAVNFLEPYIGTGPTPVLNARKGDILTALCGGDCTAGVSGDGYIAKAYAAITSFEDTTRLASCKFAICPPFSVYAAPDWAYAVQVFLWLNKVGAVVAATPCKEGSSGPDCELGTFSGSVNAQIQASYENTPIFIDNIIAYIPQFTTYAQNMQQTVVQNVSTRLLSISEVSELTEPPACPRNEAEAAEGGDPLNMPVYVVGVVDPYVQGDTQQPTLVPQAGVYMDPTASYSASCGQVTAAITTTSVVAAQAALISDMNASPATATMLKQNLASAVYADARTWLAYTTGIYQALWNWDAVIGSFPQMISSWNQMLQTFCAYIPPDDQPPTCNGGANVK